ncbi:hypothetical protein BCR42DRAFT_405074, partial [Absidia repens]
MPPKTAMPSQSKTLCSLISLKTRRHCPKKNLKSRTMLQLSPLLKASLENGNDINNPHPLSNVNEKTVKQLPYLCAKRPYPNTRQHPSPNHANHHAILVLLDNKISAKEIIRHWNHNKNANEIGTRQIPLWAKNPYQNNLPAYCATLAVLSNDKTTSAKKFIGQLNHHKSD